jgi:hypothetical protein
MRAGPLSPYVNADAPKRAAAPSLHEPATGAVTRVRASVCVGALVNGPSILAPLLRNVAAPTLGPADLAAFA